MPDMVSAFIGMTLIGAWSQVGFAISDNALRSAVKTYYCFGITAVSPTATGGLYNISSTKGMIIGFGGHFYFIK